MQKPLKLIVRDIIDNLSGSTFKNSEPYSEETKIFFEERYVRVLSLLPKIKAGSVGLDVGLWGGILAFLLTKVFLLEKLYALEHPTTCRLFTKSYLRRLQENNIVPTPVDLRLGKFPWHSEFFDFVIFSEVMEHLVPADIPPVIREIRRVLKRNAWFFVSTPNISSLLKRINLVLGKNPVEFDLNLHEGATYGHIREYTMSELIDILKDAGFEVEKKSYFMIDTKRNIFTRIEAVSSRIFPSLANSIGLIARKV